MSNKIKIISEKWVADGFSVRTESGETVVVTRSREIAEYIVTLHGRCFHMPYVAGQLDLDLELPVS